MAKLAKKSQEPKDPLESEAIDRLREARRWKESTRILDFKELYFFLAPWRQRQISSMTEPSLAPMLDAPELYTDLGFLITGDFITEVINTYVPEAQLWCERKPGEGFEEVFDQIKDQIKDDDKKIFSAIKASNFYSELPKSYYPDLVIAGAGMWIHRRQAHMPIECLAVPMREMEINLGPDGDIDDRFVVRHGYNKYLRMLLGDDVYGKIDSGMRQKLEENPTARTMVSWGFWRKWEDITDEVWQHVILLEDKLIHSTELRGEGCCPFIVTRFNPTADWPWAFGPAEQGLPTLRQVDELERQKLEAVERSVNPAITYPDDSFSEVEQGIEPGMAYPIRPGTEGAVKRMYDQPPLQPEMYQLQELEKRLRKLFFVDYPEQSGDTPPTLGQWLDEMARAQRRIGTSGMSFWREGPRSYFLRFKYLLEAAGTIKKLQDKAGRAISTQPYNPAQRAAEQQEIATATQCAQMSSQLFPEEWKLVVDGKATIEAFVEKMRASGLLKMRNPDQIQQILKQITPLVGGRRAAGGGGEPPEEAGAPGPT
jgi:Bacteriophage head to tail connecting protein